MHFWKNPDLWKPQNQVSQSNSKPVSRPVYVWPYPRLCPPSGMPLSSPLSAGTQMAWGGSDQGEGLSVCQSDSSSVPEAHYQAAATATAMTTTAMQPPDFCMQLTAYNTKHQPICDHSMPLISGKTGLLCSLLLWWIWMNGWMNEHEHSVRSDMNL